MKKIFKILPILTLAIVGVSSIVSFSSVKESKKLTKVVHALPEGLVDTYDVVTLSDISYTAQSTYVAGNDWTNPTDYGFFHKSSTNTTGSVVFKYKQHVTSYPKSGKSINTVLRGTNYYNDGFEFYHTDNDWRSVQIRVKNESNKIIAEWWGGASGNVFKDNVTHEVEIGAIDYVSGNKTYCYYMLDGVVIASADYENTNNYDFNHPFATVRASSSIPATLTDSDDHRLVAKYNGSAWYSDDSNFLFFGSQAMDKYSGINNSGFNGWGHFLPSSGATLQYQHAGGSTQNLTSLALPFNNATAINLPYNGLSATAVENDKIVISGLFRQETSSTNHINAVFSVEPLNLRYIAGTWYLESEYQAVVSFVNDYMSMDTDVVGQCNTLYGPAKEAYNSLSSNAKTIFNNGLDFVDAKNRLSAWATAKGDIFATNISNAKILNSTMISSDNYIFIYILCFVIALIIPSFIFVKRRSKNRDSF